METIIGIVVGAAVSIISILFGRWLSRNDTTKAVDMSFSKASDLIKWQDFLREAGIFKSAFNITREIITLDTSHDSHMFSKLWAEIPAQECAIVRFEVCLPQSQRTKLWKAWKEYRRQNEADFYNEYFTENQIKNGDFSNDKEKQFILDRIDNLFHFTDPNCVFGKQ